MNIFEYLGLSSTHRKLANKVTQLVKHWDEVVEKHKKGKTFAVQVKKDGVCSLTIIKDGTVAIFSRTGKRFTNTETIAKRISDLNLRDGVYMGELYVPKSICSLEQLSGIVNPNRTKPLDQEGFEVAQRLKMAFFDLVSIESFIEGASQTSFTRRHSNLVDRVGSFIPDMHCVEVLDCSLYKDAESIRNALSFVTSGGEEGIVIRDPNADWEAGHKGWRVMKMVRGVDYDLECTGVEEGTGKYAGKAANLLFKWKGGEHIKCMLGKGWTHDDAAYFFTNPPIGSVFQVYALEESSKGKLRLPKVGEKRHDKDKADV